MTGQYGRRPIQRALISVYDKTGLLDLARGLHETGVDIVSTGSPRGRGRRTTPPAIATVRPPTPANHRNTAGTNVLCSTPTATTRPG